MLGFATLTPTYDIPDQQYSLILGNVAVKDNSAGRGGITAAQDTGVNVTVYAGHQRR